MSRILRVFTIIFGLIFAGNLFIGDASAAYSCTYKYTACAKGYYLTSASEGNSCSKCSSGYTSAGGATVGQSSACYKSCTKACTQQTCPSNATCTHGTGSTNGTQYYGGSCDAAASTCSITITCNANYYKSGNSCVACSSVSYTESSSDTEAVTGGGSRTRSKTRTCYRSTSSAGSTSSSACGGTSSCGNWSYGEWKYTCPSATYWNGSACTACTANYYCAGFSNIAAGSLTSTYGRQGCPSSNPYSNGGASLLGHCYKNCTKTCSGNNTSACPANATCTYNTSYTYSGTEYYSSTCNATVGTCPVSTITCNANYYKNGNTCSPCPSGYPYSAAGSTSITSCYSGSKSRAWTGSQTACSQPSNSTAYSCNTCSNSACTYVAYSNSAGTGDGTIKSGCSSNSASCQQTVKSGSVSCAANYYVSGTSCLTCSSKSSSYPYSAGGNIDYNSCYTNVTRGCTQNNGSTPSGCASVTAWNACSCTGGTYQKFYNGTTSGTTSNETCTKTPKSVTANANNYVSGVTCPTCSSFSSTYTKSDGGNISNAYCYKDVTKTGSQNTCSKPSNSHSHSCNTCSPGTCTYKDYYSATDTTCTPSNCTQTATVNSCAAGYYKDSNACSACDSGYTSTNGMTSGRAYCYKTCASKTGYTLTGGVDYYSATDTCAYSACTYTVAYNANGGSGTTSSSTHTYDSSKALTSNGFTRTGYTFAGWATTSSGSVAYGNDASVKNLTSTCGDTVTLYAKWTANTYTCSAGQYLDGTTCKTCDSGYYCPGGTWTYNGGVQGRSTCPTDSEWPVTSNAGSGAIGDCYINITATTKSTNCSSGGMLVYYNTSTSKYDGTATEVSTYNAKANSYVTGSGRDKTCSTCSSFSSTYTKSDGGNISNAYCYKDATKTGSQNTCSKPSNSYSHSCNSCSPGTCPYKDYYSATDTTCTPSNCNQTATVNSCAAGYYKDGNACSVCDSGYTSTNGMTNGRAYCYKTCAAKTGYTLTSGVDYYSATDTCAYSPNKFTVEFNGNSQTSGSPSVSSVECTYDSACTAATMNTLAKTKKVFLGWSTSSTATSATYSSGGNIKNISTGSKVTLYAVWKEPTCSASTGVASTSLNSVSGNAPVCNRSSKDGYYCSATQTGSAGSTSLTVTCSAASKGYYAKAGATSQSQCSAGTYTDTTAKSSCSNITAGCYGGAGSTSSCPNSCPTDSEWPVTSGSGSDAISDCYINITATQKSTNCSSGGMLVYYNTSTSKYNGTATEVSAYNANSGYYVTGSGRDKTCSACGSVDYYCPGGTSAKTPVSSGYYTTGGTTTTRNSQTKCEKGYYCSGGVRTSCPAGTYGSSEGLTSSACTGSCTAGYYCPAGSSSATQNACGGGKYSASGAKSSSDCKSIDAGCYGTSASGSCPNKCAAGTYSTGGASACTNVNKGCYADTTGSTTACPKSCPAGTYGSTTGLKTSACSGQCAANHYCPAGSTSSEQNDCPSSNPYSNAGAGSIGYCYKNCTKTCSGNNTSACPANATCTYNTGYTYSGIEYYSGTCDATVGLCPLVDFSCNKGYSKNSAGTACVGNTITVNYTENGGGAVSNGSCTYGGSFTLASAPSRTGYTFTGWKLPDGSVKSAGTSVSCNYSVLSVYELESTVITAQWQPNTYTVAYNANGGSGTTASSTHIYDSSKALTANGFTNGLKKFLGWSTSSSATSATYTNAQSVKNLTATSGATVTLYAVWGTDCTCSKGTGVASCTAKAPLGVCGTATATAASGYQNATCAASDANGNSACSASIITYSISYTLNGGTNYSGAPTSYNVTTSTITLGTPTRANSTFGGWYNESSFTNKITQIAKGSTGNKTLHAKWTCNTGYTADGNSCKANTFSVMYDGNGATGGSAPTALTSCTYDKDCIVPANTYTRPGYVFAGWKCTGGNNICAGGTPGVGGNIKNASTGATITLTAQWTQCAWSAGANSTIGSASTDTANNRCQYTVTCNTGYSKSGNTDTTSSFTAYGTAGSASGTLAGCSARKYNVTYSCGDGGGTAPSATTATYNSSFTPAANTCSRTGYTFAGWTVSGTSDVKAASTAFTWKYAADKTLTAKWNLNTYSITYYDGSSTMSLSPSSYDVTSATFNLPTPYKAGYQFVAWHAESASGTVTTQVAKGSTGNKKFYVEWKECPAGYVCNGSSVAQCSAGTYCPEGSSSAKTCPGLYKNSKAGSDAAEDCYFTTSGGFYIASKDATSQTRCEVNNYCPATTLYYPNTSSKKSCPDPTNSAYQESLSDMDWLTERCPTATASNSSIKDAAFHSWSATGTSSITQCRSGMHVSTPCATFTIESMAYDSTTGKYDTDQGSVYTGNVNAGYYLTERYSSDYCNTTTNSMLYKKAVKCPANSYCPGGSVPVCSSGTYNESWGANTCSGLGNGYNSSTECSTSSADCYLTLETGKYVGTEGGAQTTCPKGSFCPNGGSKVYYGMIAGRTECGIGTYNALTGSSAATACIACPGGTYGAQKGMTSAACSGTCESGYYCPENSTSSKQNQCPSTHPKSEPGSDAQTDCYKDCTKACTQQTCPLHATCTHGTSTSSGRENYNGTCNASQLTCSLSFTCDNGYVKSTDGTKCNPREIVVNYNENEGGSIDNGSCVYNSTLVLPSAPSRTGYIFDGWKLADGSIKQAGDSVTCNNTNLGTYGGNSTAVTAQWTPVTYVIVFDPNGGDGRMQESAHTYDQPKALIPNGFSNGLKRFLGWSRIDIGTPKYKNAEIVTNVTSVNNARVTLYAIWGDDCTCSLGTGVKSCTPTVDKGICGTATATPSGGYEQAVCTPSDANGNSMCSGTVLTYTISYTLNGGTNYADAPKTYQVTTPTIVLGTPTRANSTFGGWYTESTFTNKIVQITKGSTGNQTLYANWTCNEGYHVDGNSCQPNVITLAWTNGGHGTVPSATTSCTYGTTFSAPSAMSATGYTFGGWAINAKTFASGATVNCTKADLGVASGTATFIGKWTANTYTCSAGQYLDGTTCKNCESGYYCPQTSWTYNGALQGLFQCPPDSTWPVASDAKATKATQCYVGITATTKSEYCSSGGMMVYYNATAGSYTGTVNESNTYKANANSYVTGSGRDKTCEPCSGGFPSSDGGNISNLYCFTSCGTGYSGRNYYDAPDTCTPDTYTITLRNYNDNATHSTIYEKYATGWYSNSGATSSLGKASVPSRDGFTFRGFYTEKQDDLTSSGGSGTRRITNDGSLPSNTTFSANTNLYAAWATNCVKPTHGTCSLTINSDGTAKYSATCEDGYTVSNATTATPSCNANTFSVMYDGNGATGGSAPTALTSCTYDKDCIVPANTYTRSGYVFAGWKCTGGNTICDGGTPGVGGNIKNASTGTTITLTAQWAQCAWSAGANSTIGSASTDTANNRCQYTVTCSTRYSQNGGADRTTSFTAYGTAGSASGILAGCLEQTFAINYDSNGATGGSAPSLKSCTYSGDCIVPENTFEKSDETSEYFFVNWICTGGAQPCNGERVKPGTNLKGLATGDSLTLTPVWHRRYLKVTLNDNGGSGGSGTVYVDFRASGDFTPITGSGGKYALMDSAKNYITKVAIPTRSGYVFQGYEFDWCAENNKGYYDCLRNGGDFNGESWLEAIDATGVPNTKITGVSATISDRGTLTVYAKWSPCASASKGSNVASAKFEGVVNNVCQYKHVCDNGYYNASHNKNTSASSISCSACSGLPTNGQWTSGATTASTCSWDCKPCVKGTNAASCSVTKGTNSCTYAGTCVQNTYKPTQSGATISCSACPSNSTSNAGNASSTCTCAANHTVGGTVGGATQTSGDACLLQSFECEAGYYVQGSKTSCTICPAGSYCPSTKVTYSYNTNEQGRTLCDAGTYQPDTGKTSCIEASAGYHVSGKGQTTQTACTGATYQDATKQTSCKSCPTYETYSSKVLGKQYWVADGIHDTIDGCQVRMNEPVADDTGNYDGQVYCQYSSTAGDFSSCWVYQQANSCASGYYYAAGVGNNTNGTATTLKGNVCKPVTTGYWSAADSLTRTACGTGLVTCGSGACANEAADCGRKLHAGGSTIYLRSAERSNPSLRVKVGDTTFYGALSTSLSGALKVKNGSTTYSVVNDWQ